MLLAKKLQRCIWICRSYVQNNVGLFSGTRCELAKADMKMHLEVASRQGSASRHQTAVAGRENTECYYENIVRAVDLTYCWSAITSVYRLRAAVF